MKQVMQMRKILFSLAVGFLALGASAQSMKFISVSYPGIYCHFAQGCQVSPTEQSDNFAPTNGNATCTLESRSFPGSTMDSTGQYGYEYRISINDNSPTDTNVVMVDSLSLKFGEPCYFPFGGHASNQLWVVTTGGTDGYAPSSASVNGSRVLLTFDPPIALDASTNQNAGSFYFGMISSNAPELTRAIITGSVNDPTNGPIPFRATLQAQTP
jgi:hypothetical protein